MEENILFEIYKSSRTVFRISDVALLAGNNNYLLSQKMNRLVKKGRLLNIRKGIYAKEGYNPEELACLLYTPTYISLDYVLQKSGVIFQYNSAITNVCYLCREIYVGNQAIQYRQAKKEILLNTTGITQINSINIATPERAFLDMLYLTKYFYFDNIKPLNINDIFTILPLYKSTLLTKEVEKILNKNGYR